MGCPGFVWKACFLASSILNFVNPGTSFQKFCLRIVASKDGKNLLAGGPRVCIIVQCN